MLGVYAAIMTSSFQEPQNNMRIKYFMVAVKAIRTHQQFANEPIRKHQKEAPGFSDTQTSENPQLKELSWKSGQEFQFQCEKL